MGLEDIGGTFFPIALLLFSLSYFFYFVLLKVKREIKLYREYLALSRKERSDIQRYIDEVRKATQG